MRTAQQGDTVRIDYTGTLKDGSVFDSTTAGTSCCSDDCDVDEHATGDCGCGCEEGPMELKVGAGQLFPEIDEAVTGMVPGEKKTVVIPAAKAFGDYDDDKVFTVPRSSLPDDFNPEVGEELVLTNDEDEEIGVTVVEVNADGFRFDANHPLAGQDLTYELQLVEIL